MAFSFARAPCNVIECLLECTCLNKKRKDKVWKEEESRQEANIWLESMINAEPRDDARRAEVTC